MEVIKQKVYTYGDGIPAVKSGEWPGIRPSHWKGSKLILKPLRKNKISAFERSIGGQRHFPQMYSNEAIYKPHKRLLPPFIHDDLFKLTKRYIDPHYTEPKQYKPHKVQEDPDQVKEEYHLQSKRHFSKSGSNLNEITVEDIMTRKKRILSQEEMRNELKMFNPGDKLYRCAENAPDFFKMEGIIVGSTNGQKIRKTSTKKSDTFFDTLDLNVRSLNPFKLWKSKVMRESLEGEKGYVEQLANWEKNFLNENKGK